MKNQEYLLDKSGLTEEDFNFILNSLLEKINLISFEEFWDEFDQAVEIMKSIDEKDAPFLAVGMYLKADGIWTEDKDFQKQKALKVYSTKKLSQKIKNRDGSPVNSERLGTLLTLDYIALRSSLGRRSYASRRVSIAD